MPIYEYRCPKCQALVEKLQPMDAPITLPCATCQTEMPRVQSQTNFRMAPEG